MLNRKRKNTSAKQKGDDKITERVQTFFTAYFNKHPLSRQDIKNMAKQDNVDAQNTDYKDESSESSEYSLN